MSNRKRLDSPKLQRSKGGFTLVEVMIGAGVLAVALLGVVAALLHTARLNAVNNDSARAQRAAEQVFEIMEGAITPTETFQTIFARFNGVVGDDLGASPYAGGTMCAFDVLPSGSIVLGGTAGQTLLQRATANTPVGRIFFPEAVPGVLSEVAGPDLGLGMPRDLTGNGDSIEPNVNTSHILLPCLVRMTFRGSDNRVRTVEYRKILVRR